VGTVLAFTVPIDMVFGEIGSEICSGRDAFRDRGSYLCDFEKRAGTLVSLAIEEEIIGMNRLDDNEVALDVSGRETVGNLLVLPRSDKRSCDLSWASWFAFGHVGGV
jgi:hypothetical protein